MKGNIKSVKVAVVQASPVIMDINATVEKTLNLIKEAGKKGAHIVVFPESFIPAYPRGLTFGFVVGSRTMDGRKDWQRYYENSVPVPSNITDVLGKSAQEAGIYLSIGVTERDGEGLNHTLYCTNLFFGPDGKLLGKHRKLKPTGTERSIWGEGDASTLTVLDTPYGKLGSLICWENYMPLARVAMYSKGVTIYIAPTADSREEWQSTMKHIALEGRCFVIGCNQYVEKSMYPTDLNCYNELEDEPEIMCSGGSCIVNPFGKYVAEPVYNREEILIADLELDEIIQSRIDFDVMGHYSRPDVFEFSINSSEI
ncbi:MAG: carbon-nitrogen hydrolase family protein [Tepidibacter sp.]|jgi:nitrilase|uniref:carbon-nitrogen hydrolase family protein n=1 Tax=Tepidibacter sp. TaxID=2529387 RepID=UPI0025F34E08|nr:carbon-nitrogen hydrolase family protein [Tepidibacter sp.]MCT4508496.1 carbon-nitrogen hydrolase family protein [Tepidibacter sp.]